MSAQLSLPPIRGPCTTAEHNLLHDLRNQLTRVANIKPDMYAARQNATLSLIGNCFQAAMDMGDDRSEAFDSAVGDLAQESWRLLAEAVRTHFAPSTKPEDLNFANVNFNSLPIDSRGPPQNAKDKVLERKYRIQTFLDALFSSANPFEWMVMVPWVLEACLGRAMELNLDAIFAKKKDSSSDVVLPEVKGYDQSSWKKQMLPLVLAALVGVGRILASKFPEKVFELWGRKFLWVFDEGEGDTGKGRWLEGEEIEKWEAEAGSVDEES